MAALWDEWAARLEVDIDVLRKAAAKLAERADAPGLVGDVGPYYVARYGQLVRSPRLRRSESWLDTLAQWTAQLVRPQDMPVCVWQQFRSVVESAQRLNGQRAPAPPEDPEADRPAGASETAASKTAASKTVAAETAAPEKTPETAAPEETQETAAPEKTQETAAPEETPESSAQEASAQEAAAAKSAAPASKSAGRAAESAAWESHPVWLEIVGKAMARRGEFLVHGEQNKQRRQRLVHGLLDKVCVAERLSARQILAAIDEARAGQVTFQWSPRGEALAEWIGQQLKALKIEAFRPLLPQLSRAVGRAIAPGSPPRRQVEAAAVAALRQDARQQVLAWARRETQRLISAPRHEAPLIVVAAEGTEGHVAVVDAAGRLEFAAALPLSDAAAPQLERLWRERPGVATIVLGDHCPALKSMVATAGAALDPPPQWSVIDARGAKWWAASSSARAEMPSQAMAVRAAVFAARRLQDPVSAWGDVPAAEMLPEELRPWLGEEDHPLLERDVDRRVHHLGLDVNRAGVRGLSRIDGIPRINAGRLHAARLAQGRFGSRARAVAAAGLSPQQARQAAAFLRVFPLASPAPPAECHCSASQWDGTGIHPDDAALAESVLARIEAARAGAAAPAADRDEPPLETIIESLASQQGEARETVAQVFDELMWAADPRADATASPVFRDRVVPLAELQPGQVVDGVVRRVTEFGALIDIGASCEALLHISRIERGFVADTFQRLAPAWTLRLRVLEVDPQRGRIAVAPLDAPVGNRKGAAAAGQPQTAQKTARSKASSSADEAAASAPPSGAARASRSRPGRAGAGRKSGGKPGGGKPVGSRVGKSGGKAVAARKPRQRPPVPPSPLSSEMAEGKAPLRSFSDLLQFYDRKDSQTQQGEDE